MVLNSVEHFDIEVPFGEHMGQKQFFATIRVFYDVVLQRVENVCPLSVDEELSKNIVAHISACRAANEPSDVVWDSTLRFKLLDTGTVDYIEVVGDAYEALEVLIQYHDGSILRTSNPTEQTLQRCVSMLSYVETELESKHGLRDLSKIVRNQARELEEIIRNTL